MKWTGLPAVLTSRASLQATSPIQAAQPRSSTQGRAIASRKPGSGRASGLSSTSSSPVAASAPALAAAAKPVLEPIWTTRAAGASSRDQLRGAVLGAVVGDDQLVAVAQLLDQGGSVVFSASGAVPGDDDDGEPRIGHAAGG